MDCPLTDVLPNELILAISGFLTSNTDVKNFAVTCRKNFGILVKELYQRDIQSGWSYSLQWACRTGQLSTLNRALSFGASVNQVFNAPLPDVFNITVSYETLLTYSQMNGETPLITAICYQKWGIVHHLLDRGADLGQCDQMFPPSFPLQCLLCQLDWPLERFWALKRFLDMGADPNGLASGNTRDLPLFQALVQPAPPEVVWLLLEKGADIRKAFSSVQTGERFSVLGFYSAAIQERMNLTPEWFQKLRYILQYHRKESDPQHWYGSLPPKATIPNHMNKQFLEVLVEEGYRPDRRSLVDVSRVVSELKLRLCSVQIQKQGGLDKMLSLGVEMIRILLQAGTTQQQSNADRSADYDRMCLDAALFYLCQCKFEAVDVAILMLLAHGANPNSTDANGLTTLHHAYILDMDQRVKYLIKHKANVDAKDCYRCTPQLYAASEFWRRSDRIACTVEWSKHLEPGAD